MLKAYLSEISEKTEESKSNNAGSSSSPNSNEIVQIMKVNPTPKYDALRKSELQENSPYPAVIQHTRRTAGSVQSRTSHSDVLSSYSRSNARFTENLSTFSRSKRNSATISSYSRGDLSSVRKIKKLSTMSNQTRSVGSGRL